MNSYKRLLVLIDKKFQLGLTFFVISVIALQNICFIIAVNIWGNKVLSLVSDTETANQLSNFKFDFLLMLSLFSLLTCAIIFVVLIFKTHKIAGPIYKLIKTLKESKESGKVEKLIFRKDDYFFDLPEIYNATIKDFETPEEKVES